MRKPIFSTIALVLACVAFLGGAAWIQHENIYRWRTFFRKFRDTLYLPSSEYVRVTATGYDMVVADLLWLRMIQVFAAGWTTEDSPKQMKHYFDIVTDLNPRFVDAYSFAIMAVGEEHRQTEMVQDIVAKAVRNNPFRYEIPYEGAFYANWKIEDAQLAEFYARLAVMDPNVPNYVRRWIQFFELKQGKYRVAFEKYLSDYLRDIAANNHQLYGIHNAHLNRAINDWFKDELRQRAIEWKDERGVYPTVDELNAGGRFLEVELPDVVYIRNLINASIEHGGRVLTDENIMNHLNRALRDDWVVLPPGPYEFQEPSFPGFVVWPYWDEDNEFFAISSAEAVDRMKYVANNAITDAEAYQEARGGQCPSEFSEFITAPELLEFFTEYVDPFGGNWSWDAENCEIVSSSFPNITTMTVPAIR